MMGFTSDLYETLEHNCEKQCFNHRLCGFVDLTWLNPKTGGFIQPELRIEAVTGDNSIFLGVD